MGRWGDELYDSDGSLDFLSIITDKLDRELTFLMSSEQILEDGYWIDQVLAVVELMLLFEQHRIGSGVYLQSEKTIQNWRQIFFNVWDADWQANHQSHIVNVFDNAEYRKQHRAAVVERFDYLVKIAHGWTEFTNHNIRIEIEPLPPDCLLPYYSISHLKTKDGAEFSQVGRFIADLMGFLEREIIYWLSSEKRAETRAFNVEEVWVSAHVLGFLAEKYERTSGVNEQEVHAWRTKTIDIWKSFLNDDRIN